ncbi:aldehyde dehydrogenase [Glutamicibacter uratoxydans]|uniref:aldehyde dehydrogenase n=1 Tax=Glutamicibacter uratoxydans TaxID=43667 RepID=UPI003D6FFD01
MFVDGKHVETSRSGRTFDSVDPSTQQAWARVPDADASDVDLAVAAANQALVGPWGETTGVERARVLRSIAEKILQNLDYLAELEARDSGRLLRDAKTQVRLVVDWFYYFAGLADKFTGQTIPTGHKNMMVYTEAVPVGTVGIIVPWNAPLLLLAWKLAPALAVGCTVVVKPSDYTPATALALGPILQEAGVPDGAFNVVTGFGPAVGEAITAHPRINKIAFTGSTATGMLVGKAAMSNMTRVTLELGGKSAQLVFEDADIESALNGVMNGIFVASGQTCMAGSRLLLHESIHDKFVAELVKRAEAIRIGPPTDPSTQIGPIVNAKQHTSILEKIATAQRQGATLVCGGGVPSSVTGWYVEPTIFTDVEPDMEIAQEEVFGPVMAVMKFSTEAEAIELANNTRFGLAAGVWSQSVHRAHRVSRQLRAGTVWVNTYRAFSPAAPFGGFGHSGLGRENGLEAMRSFSETRTVWIEMEGETRDPFSV